MSSEVVASKVPFADLCKVCEKISSRQGKEKKQGVLKDFIQTWRNFHSKLHSSDAHTTTDSFFPALRLLLPQFEKERGAYGIKEMTLAKLYIDILCLSKDSPDAQKLLNYRAPQNAKAVAGDFANVAYFVLKNRCPQKGSLTIENVNNCLDTIAIKNSEKRKDLVRKELLHLLTNTSAEEQKWLIRMIMKSLKFGVSEQSVLNLFHPDAKDLYDVSNSISKVCSMLHDPNVRLHEIDIALFSPFRPMLAETANPEKVEKIMQANKWYVETKHDGERMQLHTDGKKYMYFSRSGNDFTNSFGSSALQGPLTRYINGCFSNSVKNCIVDGEMVGYNIKTNCIGSKGENFDVKSLQDGDVYQPCFCVFDIVMYNGKVLSNLPLRERLTFLKDLFTPLEGRIHYTPRTEISTKQEAIDALNNAIDCREEGIVVKNPESVYKPNTRRGGWYKIKPEYVDDLMEQLDLIIVGGYFGEGRRRGLISHFLLGLAVPSNDPGERPSVFHSMCRVGSGYTYAELYELCLQLNEHWQPYDRRNPPTTVLIGPGSKERPDLWIEPSKSRIVQVKAAEITKSGKFMVGYTLRFPRVEKVRSDKQWHECMTLTEFEDLREQSQGKLAQRRMSSVNEGEPSPKKKRIAAERIVTLAPQFRGIDPTAVKKKVNIFSGKEMCIINCPPSHTKQELEKLVLERFGTVVQNPSSNTFCVLAHKTAVRVKNVIASNIYDVVKTEWLLHCVEENKCLPWTPTNMWHCSPKTTEKLAQNFDRFGDGYEQATDEENLRLIFQKMDEGSELSHETMANLEEEYFPNTSPLGLFRRCTAYFDSGSSLKVEEFKFRFYGGIVKSSIDETVGHVIMHEENLTNLLSITSLNRNRKKFHIVTRDWISHCIVSHFLLKERNFQP